MFLHHIMKQEKESLLFQFFLAQVRSPSQNDWVSQVIKDLEEIDLDIEFEDIENTSKDIVLSHVQEYSFAE